jgi:prefoldin beta subunit
MVEDNATEEKITQLQLYEQSLQSLILQKQQFQAQINETESALKELVNSSDSYRIIGNIMVKADKNELKKELEEKKSTSSLRIKSIEKQESIIRQKVESLQQEVMKKIQ